MPRIKKYYIAVDFDGTLCIHKFPEIGVIRTEVVEKIAKRVELIRSLNREVKVILWTCREDTPERAYLTEAIEWWNNNGYDKRYFPIDYLNENPDVTFGYPELVRKIFANEYWDDRAVGV